MARVTVEKCNKYITNRFELVLVAAQRGKELNHGALALIDKHKEKDAIIALREIEAGLLDIMMLKKAILKKNVINNQEENSTSIEKSKDMAIIQENTSLRKSSVQASEQLFSNEQNINE